MLKVGKYLCLLLGGILLKVFLYVEALLTLLGELRSLWCIRSILMGFVQDFLLKINLKLGIICSSLLWMVVGCVMENTQ